MDEEVPSEKMRQLWLIPYRNPLREKLTARRMKEIPEGPGVYLFYDCEGALLYVGKSKSLRKRVNSYRFLNPVSGSRKTMRLVHTAERVEVESTENEMRALLRENELIREHRPPFNVANAKPESYHYLAVRIDSASKKVQPLRLRIMPNAEPEEGEQVFGAFKNRGTLQKIYGTLLRALWLYSFDEAHSIEYPHEILVSRLPPSFTLEFGQTSAEKFVKFMSGEGEDFLKIYEVLGETTESAFMKSWLKADHEALALFSKRSLQIHQMVSTRSLSRNWITPAEVDDFIVEERFRKE